jgi:hypothetical protein
MGSGRRVERDDRYERDSRAAGAWRQWRIAWGASRAAHGVQARGAWRAGAWRMACG